MATTFLWKGRSPSGEILSGEYITESKDELIGYLIGIVVVVVIIYFVIVYIVLPIVGVLLGIGVAILAIVAFAGLVSGIVVGINNFFIVFDRIKSRDNGIDVFV